MDQKENFVVFLRICQKRRMSEARARSESGQTSELAGELRLVIGRVMKRLRQEAHLLDLSWSQIKVLSHLDQGGPATVTALAQAEGVRPQSMGATVAALEAAGLVAGAPHPTDGRQTLWSLTELCRQKVAENRAVREDWLFQKLAEHFSSAEQDELTQALRLLRRLAAD
jgi:DNA-binding MarR family transcriptional regulator